MNVLKWSLLAASLGLAACSSGGSNPPVVTDPGDGGGNPPVVAPDPGDGGGNPPVVTEPENGGMDILEHLVVGLRLHVLGVQIIILGFQRL